MVITAYEEQVKPKAEWRMFKHLNHCSKKVLLMDSGVHQEVLPLMRRARCNFARGPRRSLLAVRGLTSFKAAAVSSGRIIVAGGYDVREPKRLWPFLWKMFQCLISFVIPSISFLEYHVTCYAGQDPRRGHRGAVRSIIGHWVPRC